MKAKKIHDILKPKSNSDVLEYIKDIKIPSYRLSSYFELIYNKEATMLKTLCAHINVKPENMEILKFNTAISNILKKAFISNTDKWYYQDSNPQDTNSFHNNNYYSNRKSIFYTSKTHKMICKYTDSGPNDQIMYIVYPKIEINNILTHLLINK